MTINNWLLGAFVTFVLGHLAVALTFKLLRGSASKPTDYKMVSPWITGFIERLFFMVAVAFTQPATTIAMMAWIAAQMGARWNTTKDVANVELMRTSALLGGIVSMLFALVGGLICNGTLQFDT